MQAHAMHQPPSAGADKSPAQRAEFSGTGMKDWLSESFSVLRANLGAFYVFALLAEAVSALILEASGMGAALRGSLQGNSQPDQPVTPVQIIQAAPGGALGGVGILLLSTVPPLAFASATIAHGTLRYRAGDPATVGECLALARVQAAGLIVSGVIAWIGIFFGLMAFLIPGMVVFAFFFLTWPAIVAEGTGPIRGLQRSVALTKGIRFQIVTVFALLILGLVVTGEIVATVLSGSGVLGTVALMALQAVFVAYGAVLAAVVYERQLSATGGRTASPTS
jgi:hypothetical protein